MTDRQDWCVLRGSLCCPNCRGRLAEVSETILACESCHTAYPVRSFGPDLVPHTFETAGGAVAEWRDVRQALAGWRKRTWTGSADAEARTREARTLASAFLAATGPRGRVVDIGCGTGWIRELLAGRGCTYAGVDPDPLEEQYAFPFVRGVSDCLPFVDASFDACLFCSSLDYSVSIDATLASVRRVLKPGGLMAVATPIHSTKAVSGERLHNHRFLAGEIEALMGASLGAAVSTVRYRPEYHFIWARRAA